MSAGRPGYRFRYRAGVRTGSEDTAQIELLDDTELARRDVVAHRLQAVLLQQALELRGGAPEVTTPAVPLDAFELQFADLGEGPVNVGLRGVAQRIEL